MKIKVAIIDSGVEDEVLGKEQLKYSYVLRCDNEMYKIEADDFPEDFIGHGTAVADIILQNNTNIDIISFRYGDKDIEIDEKGLECILSYIYEFLDVDIINISGGVTYMYEDSKLHEICRKLYKKGIIIVSAFDNAGAVSFPAAFDEVIGVDVIDNYENKFDTIWLKNSIVDLYIPNIYYRTTWKGKRTVVKGTSFAAARVTALLAERMANNISVDRNKDMLLDDLSDILKIKKVTQEIQVPLTKPKKAIIFPINKESMALLRYKELLDFEIVGVYDEKYSGNIGRVIFGEKVGSYEEIDWSGDFDTVVLSCSSELSRLTKKDYGKIVLDNVRKTGKYLYSFEKIDTEYKRYFYPEISQQFVNYKNELKMNKISIPVVCVLGTSSKQGKYSLQLELISRMRKMGYKVGHVATEPSGYLLGADYVYHFGYHSYLSIQPWESISIVNRMMFETQQRGRDIIITGGQSGMLHYNNNLIEHFGLFQYAFLLGAMPDIVIMCINAHDELNYIKRTIDFINAVDDGKIIALVLYPIQAVETITGIGFKSTELSQNEINEKKCYFKEKLGYPVFLLGDELDMDDLCEQIIDHFAEVG